MWVFFLCKFLREKGEKTMENHTTFDYEEVKELPSKEEILQNEDEMIAGLLEAAAFKKDDNLQKKIEIRRNGKLLFSFFVRPLTEEEIQGCRKQQKDAQTQDADSLV